MLLLLLLLTVRVIQVCRKGQTLTPDQAALLRVFGVRMATFRLIPLAWWGNEGVCMCICVRVSRVALGSYKDCHDFSAAFAAASTITSHLLGDSSSTTARTLACATGDDFEELAGDDGGSGNDDDDDEPQDGMEPDD